MKQVFTLSECDALSCASNFSIPNDVCPHNFFFFWILLVPILDLITFDNLGGMSFKTMCVHDKVKTFKKCFVDKKFPTTIEIVGCVN